MKSTRKPRRKKSKLRWTRKARLEFYWSVLIKALADFTCEITGKPVWDYPETVLQAHHLAGKKTLALRYSLLNGICIDRSIHGYGFHHPDKSKSTTYELKATQVKGKCLWEELEKLKKEPNESLDEYEDFLIESLKPYKQRIKDYLKLKDYKDSTTKARYNDLIGRLNDNHS